MHQVDDRHIDALYKDAVALLKQLIVIPSFSREEDRTAATIEAFLKEKGVTVNRHFNNVWAVNKYFDAAKPTILLNSHHDTVKPNTGYTKDPFAAIEEDGRLYGLGSNDAGGCLVSLIAAFLYFNERTDLSCNLLIAATAEEEVSGVNGIEAALTQFGTLDFGIVGEPTLMDMAVAEKGLMVLDCIAHGTSGHAARNEGDNAIYIAMRDMEWFRAFVFPEQTALLGPVKMSVTMINAGSQHNVVPATCNFTVDIRINECYTHEQVLEIVRKHVKSEVQPRGMRLRSTCIAASHPIVVAGMNLGLKQYGSSTMSDKALMRFPALKIGPGDSARSHMADEFIYTDEIKKGISIYIQLLNEVL